MKSGGSLKSFHIIMRFILIGLYFITPFSYAIDNPDSSDLIVEFNTRSISFEKAINDPKNTNRGYLIAYNNYQIFLDKELNKAYKLLMKKLPKARQVELKKSQRGWIKYRDAEFKLIKNNWNRKDFGSSAGISRGTYRNSIVQNRILQLLHYAKNY